MTETVHPIIQPPGAVIVSGGASLRDYFAAKAMQVLMAPNIDVNWMLEHYETDSVSVAAYAQADAMLAARQPQTPSEPLPEITEPAS